MKNCSFSDIETEEEKVSFPVYTSSPPSFHLSPSSDESSVPKLHRIHQRSRSFSSLQDLKVEDKISLTEVEDEERMDMLWENFNEELSGSNGGKKDKDFNFSVSSNKLERIRHGVRELFCNTIHHHHHHHHHHQQHNSPGLMMIFKVLKKLFFIQKAGEKRTST